jgi:hypothetical protein
MTLLMVRRNKEEANSLYVCGVRAGRPLMWRRTPKEVLWLKGA